MMINNIRLFFEDRLIDNDHLTIWDWLLMIVIAILFALAASFEGCSQ